MSYHERKQDFEIKPVKAWNEKKKNTGSVFTVKTALYAK
jgi:hypothetical protein